MTYLEGITLPRTAVIGEEPEWLAAQAAALPANAVIVHLGVDGGASLICSRAGNATARIVGVDRDPRCMGLDLDAELADSRRVDFDEPVDFLFVDADHSHESVWADIENWQGRVVPGGVLAFHDYGNTHLRWCAGVKSAVDAWDWSGWTEIAAPGSIKAFRRDADA
jgi:hypothetical protein